MAARFFVGNGTAWSSTASWSTTDGGASGAAVPTSADDVKFTALSPGNCSIDVQPICLTFDCTGFTKTITSVGTTMNVNGLVFKLAATMAAWPTACAVAFVSSTGTAALTSAGQTLGNITVNSATVTVQLQDALTSNGTVTLTTGGWDTNSKAWTCLAFSSLVNNTRSLTLGSSTITITGSGAGAWNIGTATNMTMSAGTSTILFSGVGPQMTGATLQYYNVSFTLTAGSGGGVVQGSNIFNNLTFTCSAVRTANVLIPATATQTVLGTLSITGNSVLNRLLVQSTVFGLSGAIQCMSAPTLSNADFMDITLTGPTNFYHNPSFEVDAMTYVGVNTSPTSIVRSNAQAFDGIYSAAVTGNGVQGIDTYRNFNPGWDGYVLPSTTYTFTAYVRAATTGQSMAVQVSWYSDDKASLISTSQGTAVVDVNTGWSRIVLTATSPVNARRFLFRAHSNTVPANGEVHYIDAIQVTATGTAQTYAVPAFTGTSLGDCGGCSGITFDVSATQTYIGTASGNWGDVTKWTSRVPLPQDDVVVSSAFVAGRTVTVDMPRMGRNINFSGSTGAPTVQVSTATTFFGSMNLTGVGSFGNSGINVAMSGRGAAFNFTSGAVGIQGGGAAFNINVLEGSLNMQDDWTTGWGCGIQLNNGTFNTNNRNITSWSFNLIGSATKAVNLGSSTLRLFSTSGSFWSVAVTGSTVNAGTSTIIHRPASAGTSVSVFTGGGFTYYNFTLDSSASPGPIQQDQFTGANTFSGTVTIPSSMAILWPSATTTTIANLVVTGAPSGFLRLPGVGGNYVSSPDSTANSITGNITVDVNVALVSWAIAGASSVLVSKIPSAGNSAYQFYVNNTTGILVFNVSANGTAFTTYLSSVAPGFAAGSQHWVRASLVLTNGSNSVCQFYTSPDGTTWTKLGTDITGAIVASIFDSTGVLEIGSNTVGTASLAAGNFYRARLYNSALGSGSGTPVFDADFSTKAFGANTFTESSSNAATVTVNGAVAQAGDGRINLSSSTGGTPATLALPANQAQSVADYLVLQDITASPILYAGANSKIVSGCANVQLSGRPGSLGQMSS